MSSKRLSLLLPLVLVLAAAVFRYFKLGHGMVVPALENFAPWMALAFTGTLVFSKRVPFLALPLLLVAIDLAATGLRGVMHKEAVAVYGLFALAAWFASRQRGRIGIVGGLLGVIGCSLAFYLVTNTVSWLTDPNYAKTFAAWTQAMTTGLPGLPPTIWFLRNSLLSDLAFSCLLLAAYNTEASLRREERIPVLRALASH
ncbi:MAG: hypothetical protein HS117_16035 [Verrucomicrobiaceae bacterium]|jgi:hypothetical protein|nr:hypothetical protein [Verrucomicrobiaceae bacterium]